MSPVVKDWIFLVAAVLIGVLGIRFLLHFVAAG